MRILVTGGAGFIGKHLCRRLVGEGHEVWSLDERYSFMQNGRFDESSGALAMHCNVIFRNWLDANWQKDKAFHRIYHLACYASPKRYQMRQLYTLGTCSSGSSSVLMFASDKKARVLLASTSEIYGEPEVHPQPESYRGNVTTTGPRSCYDEGKRYAEALFWSHHHSEGTDTRIARIFNTYGPGMDFDDGRVISNFVTQALKGEPLTIYGDGSQTRSFCYIDDMVEGLIRLMEYEGEECHEPHNLGNPSEVTVMDLAVGLIRQERLFNTEDKKGGRSIHSELPTDDPTRRCPDITRAKRNLGWEPKVSLSEGLARTVADFRERVKS